MSEAGTVFHTAFEDHLIGLRSNSTQVADKLAQACKELESGTLKSKTAVSPCSLEQPSTFASPLDTSAQLATQHAGFACQLRQYYRRKGELQTLIGQREFPAGVRYLAAICPS